MMKTTISDQEVHQRFNVLHRVLHLVVIFNFSLLAISGFLLRFSGYDVARGLAALMGGSPALSALHRFCASFLYLGIVVHLLWLLYYKVILKGKLFGPSSLAPRREDLADIYRNIGYILGKAPSARFNRFSYLQKIDYWAVMLGMQSMGITGLLMWFPEYFSSFLPGYVINIAGHFHFHEAVLAVMYIAVVHMSDTHFSPEVFPIEKSIFTGEILAERLRREHPKEWEQIDMVRN